MSLGNMKPQSNNKIEFYYKIDTNIDKLLEAYYKGNQYEFIIVLIEMWLNSVEDLFNQELRLIKKELEKLKQLLGEKK